MSLWKIALRGLQARALSSVLTALSLALGVALVVAVLLIHGVIRETFTQSAVGYNLLVGSGKGGKLQLVLNTIYHLDAPAGNLPYSTYQEFAQGKYHSAVAQAIPVCLGDNYQGYRVVGTVPAMFDSLPGKPEQPYGFRDGRNFQPEGFFEAVVGSEVARRTGLTVGATFAPTHGVVEDDLAKTHEHDPFTVVGILDPTGTPNDRAIFVNMEGFYLMEGHAKPVDEATTSATAEGAEPHDHAHEPGHEHEHQGESPEGAHDHDAHDHDHAAETTSAGDESHDHEGHDHEGHDHDHAAETKAAAHEAQHHESHDHEGHDHEGHDHDHADHDHGHSHSHEPLPDDQKEVTAILVRTHNDMQAMALTGQLRRDPGVQAVAPARVVYELFDGLIGPLRTLLLALTGLIVVVAAIGVMVSIYNTMALRQREIAVMRALGAERTTVMAIVLWESILLALAGALGGIVLGHLLVAALAPALEARTGVIVGLTAFRYEELYIVPAVLALSAVAGIVPGLAAYRTDVAKSLSVGA